jgi:hypothetical protein
MSFKIDTNDEVVFILKDVLRDCLKQWERIPDGGTSKYEWDHQKFPKKDISNGPWMNGFQPVYLKPFKKNQYWNDVFGLLGVEKCTNSMVYGPNTGMGWHTNSILPGPRVYYTYTPGMSIFRYKGNDGHEHDDYDLKSEWTARRFVPTDTEPYLWHTIWTEKIRFSFGFFMKE